MCNCLYTTPHQCCKCGYWFELKDLVDFAGSLYCKDACIEYAAEKCELCREWIPKKDIVRVDGFNMHDVCAVEYKAEEQHEIWLANKRAVGWL